QRAELLCEVGANFRQPEHAMRIADSRGAESELASADGNLFVDDFALRARDGNLVAPETDLAHLDAYRFAAVEHSGFHESGRRLHGELLSGDKFAVPKIAREDAQAVTAFLRLAAVGIENAQRALRAIRRERAKQDAVRADAEIAVANHPHLLRRERRR